MEVLMHAHSGVRWILLVLLIWSILYAYRAKSRPHIPDKKKINVALYTMILFGFQFVLGIILFFSSHKVSFEAGFMKNSLLRFFTVEHSLIMIIALVLVHIGYIRSTKLTYTAAHRSIFVYYLIALILILAGIPWPFRGYGNGWF